MSAVKQGECLNLMAAVQQRLQDRYGDWLQRLDHEDLPAHEAVGLITSFIVPEDAIRQAVGETLFDEGYSVDEFTVQESGYISGRFSNDQLYGCFVVTRASPPWRPDWHLLLITVWLD